MIGGTINHFGLSSGKDSTALWAWAIHESGYPKESIRGSFTDTENEYLEVYDQIAALDRHGQRFGVAPIKILRNTDAWTWNQHPLFLAFAIWKKRFPGAKSRFCTDLLKILPMLYFIQELWLEGWDIVLHSGVRASESKERSVMDEWSFSNHCQVRRPALQWTIKDVWERHTRYGLPINPLYFTGRKRVGCKLCCMSNKQDIRVTAKTKPETIDQYRDWEKIVDTYKTDGIPSSFFPADKVPEHLRSIKGLVRKRDGRKGKKGSTYSANTIDDMVKWSNTLRGGKQTGFEFMFDDSPLFEVDDAHAPCKSGYCE